MTDKVMEFIKPSWLTDYGSSNSQESSSSVTTEKLDDDDVTMVIACVNFFPFPSYNLSLLSESVCL